MTTRLLLRDLPLRIASLLALLALAAPAQAQISLPVTFEESVNYELRDFGGNASQIVVDPTDAANTVVESIRTAGAAFFAGTAFADITGLAEEIPFEEGMTTMSVRVWTPNAGTPVRFKLEALGDGAPTVETEAVSTMSGMWETLVFDFSDEVDGTPPLDLEADYRRGVLFFNFGEEGAADATTYYWDDVSFGGEPAAGNDIALPITFEEDIDYELQDFGGAMSMLVADPTDAENTVVQTLRPAASECFAGTTVADVTGFTEGIPFAPDATTMSVRVWSPEAGIRVLFKVEQVGTPEINVETFTFTTVAGEWETMVFDLGNPMPNMNPIQFGATYDKASIFFDFQCNLPGAPMADRTYYWDDVAFGGAPMMGTTIAEARALGTGTEVTVSGVVTRAKGAFTYFQDDTAGITVRQTSGAFFDAVASGAIAPGTQVTVTGTTSEFNGLFQINGDDLTSYTVDGTTDVPEPQMITLAQLDETYEAELVEVADLMTDAAGTFESSTNYDVADPSGAGTLRVVGSDDSDIDGTDIPADGFTFEGVVGQFNGGSGDTGYQLLAIALGDIEADPVSNAVVTLPITFEDDIDYELVDFGGNASSLVADPEDAENTVVQSVRTEGAECFAGTTVADVTGFVDPIPFAEGMTTMNVRVWSPVAGVPVRLKVEDVNDPTVSVEAEVPTTASGMWEVLVYDFANQVPGTAAINVDSDYTKASIFFDFSCGIDPPPAQPERTYYWDDVAFGSTPPVSGEDGAGSGEAQLAQNAPNPFRNQTTISFSVPTAEHVQVRIYNALGQEVATLVDGPLAAGAHEVSLDASGLASGTYFYRLVWGAEVTTRSMVLTR